MNKQINEAFTHLFKDAYHKCFGHDLKHGLSETESRHFSNVIFEATGLVIGAKSIKNYAAYVVNSKDAKPENPSTATLDTMARYVAEAPYTDELERREKASHYPYWFEYKLRHGNKQQPGTARTKQKGSFYFIAGMLTLTIPVIFLWLLLFKNPGEKFFTESFTVLREDTLKSHGWRVQHKNQTWWNMRNVNPGALTLFTLSGDNWPDSAHPPAIQNLLIKKIDADCFATEIHLEDFIPARNWQQAGILLMEDPDFHKRCIRFSIAFNDYFGGYQRPKEIILQGLSSGGNDQNRPEEIAHIPLFSLGDSASTIVTNNLRHSALRIEKKGDHYRFLYYASNLENAAFKEAFSKEISIKPRYIGIFALQGHVSNNEYMPVKFDHFGFAAMDCKDN